MSRWQIKSLLFYSHHDQRVELPFDLSAVNIIVGESNSGKSALIDSLDYCMGASECHIPGIIAEKCAWVGVVWAKERTEIVICRELPIPPRKSNEDTYYAIGTPVTIPASTTDLHRVTNTDGALRRFEQLLLMAEVVGETFNEREGKRISFRNALPYVLVSDDVIIDKISLLRGMNDEHRLSIIESIPYFLGAVDENTAAAEIRLKKLRMQRDREERRREAARAEASQALARGAVLLQEATSLGMIEAPAGADAADGNFQALQLAAAWAPGFEVDVVGKDTLAELYARERGLLNSVSRVRSRLAAARDVLESATGFTNTVQQQRRKLDVRSIFLSGNEHDTCPICNSSIADRTVPMKSILDALVRLDGDLNEVEQDRPQIDGYIARLEAEIEANTAALPAVREQISAIVKESEANAQRLELDQRRMRVAGRVSYFLESVVGAQEAVLALPLTDIEAEIRELEAIVDPEAKAERLNALQLQISAFATEVLKDLPFDENYRDVQVMFDARKVRIQFVLGSRVYDLRDIGGDESYLSGRISALFGLHRLFSKENRPVPGVLIFDQISRPFYPPESNPGQVRIESSDRTDLKRYVDALFREVAAQKTLQIILFEHADFPYDEQYKLAVKKRWDLEEKLIPFDWPTLKALADSDSLSSKPQRDSKVASKTKHDGFLSQNEIVAIISGSNKVMVEWLFNIINVPLFWQIIDYKTLKYARQSAIDVRRRILLSMPDLSDDIQATLKNLVGSCSEFLGLEMLNDPPPNLTGEQFKTFEIRLKELRTSFVHHTTDIVHKYGIQVPAIFRSEASE